MWPLAKNDFFFFRKRLGEVWAKSRNRPRNKFNVFQSDEPLKVLLLISLCALLHIKLDFRKNTPSRSADKEEKS